jgi:hypothetical protein
MLEQNALSLLTVREPIRPVQIAQDTLRGHPLVSGHALIIGDEVGVFVGDNKNASRPKDR